MSTITVTWLCLSNRKSEHTWSHFFLFADFNGSPCCLHFGVNHLVEAHNATTESFLLHSALTPQVDLTNFRVEYVRPRSGVEYVRQNMLGQEATERWALNKQDKGLF